MSYDDVPLPFTRRSTVERRIASLEAELARLEALPPEPADADAVVWFQKTFGDTSTKPYTFAACRIEITNPRRWYLTGRTTRIGGYTWEELLDFIAKQEPSMPAVYVVNEWGRLI